MSEEISKPKKAHLRKLYLAYLIDNSKQSLVSLVDETGMPKRTIQTAMGAFTDISIECVFEQDGVRNRHGYYKINSWGPNNKKWIKDNLQYVIDVLQ